MRTIPSPVDEGKVLIQAITTLARQQCMFLEAALELAPLCAALRSVMGGGASLPNVTLARLEPRHVISVSTEELGELCRDWHTCGFGMVPGDGLHLSFAWAQLERQLAARMLPGAAHVDLESDSAGLKLTM